MATTEHFYAGTGTQTSFPFEFPYLTESDVFVALYNSSTGNFDIKQQNTSGQNNDYSISNTNIVFNTAPPQIAGVNNIHIYRNTDVETAKAVYNTGSAIRAQDLNNNTDQSLYKLQEGTQLINTDDIKDEAINSAKIKNETIVNADISSAAEIAVSKLADGSARQLLQTDAAGSGVEWASNIDIPGTLDVTGNTDIDGNLNVDGTTTAVGNVSVGGTLNVSNNTSLSGTLAVTGASTFTGAIDANGGAAIDNIRIGVSANNEIDTSSGNLIIDSATGTTTVDDNLAVTGDLTVTGSITAPLWNGAALADFWLTSSQDIDHRGQTIQLAKVSNSNATHRFSIAKDYEFEVGRRVTEGHTFGAFGNGTMQPCFQLRHNIEQTGYRKATGTSYTEVDHEESGDLNLGIGTYSGMTGNDDTIDTFRIKHAHLVFLGRKGFPAAGDPDGQQNPNSVSTLTPTLVLSGQRGAMFTHPNNTSFMRTQGSSTYSGLGYLARGAYSLGGRSINDQYNWGNNGYFSGYEGQALLESAVDFQIIVGGARAKNRFEIGSSSVAGTLSLSGVDITANATQLNVLDGLTSNTSELNKLDGFTGSTTDLNEVVTGKNVVETITGSATDAQLPTAQAVNERIVELVTEVGGFHPIANETSFPTTNPDINDGAGTIVSVKALASNLTSNGSGVATIANGAGTGNTVTINGMANNDTIESGKGILLETTTTLHTYNFHREIVDSSGVATADALVSAFNERYYGPYSANQATRPSGANRVNGDLYFNTSDGKMKVFNGTHASGTWDDVAAPGNFFINTLSSSSGSGGGSAAFNNNATRFTLSNPPLTAQQLLVSVNGVIQKPNSGTSPSEGFAIDGADIIFASAPATGAPHFIVTIGSSVNIGTPSNDTVGAAQIIDGSISNAEISSSAAIASSKLAKPIEFADNEKALFGTGSELEIFWNGSAGFITNQGGGNLHLNSDTVLLKNAANTKSYIRAYNNSSVELYHDNNKKAETSADGLKVDSNLFINSGSGTLQTLRFHNDVTGTGIVDGAAISYSTSTHALFLSCYESNGNMVFQTGGSHLNNRTLLISNSGVVTLQRNQEPMLVATPNAGVELYFDNVKKAETTATGFDVTGNIVVSGNVDGRDIAADGTKLDGIETAATADQTASEIVALIADQTIAPSTIDMEDSEVIKLGNSDDLRLYHSGSDSYIQDSGTGRLILASNGASINFYDSANASNMATLTTGGSCSFNHGATTRLETTSGGAAVTGSLGVGTTSPAENLHIRANSNVGIRLDDSGQSYGNIIYNNGSNSNDALTIAVDEGNTQAASTMRFRVDASEKMRIDSNGYVGIGTTTPNTRLDVLDSSATGILSRSASTQTTDSNKALRVRNNSSTNTFSVSYKGLGYFAGRLGIGTTSPAAPIHVESDANTMLQLESTDRYSTMYLIDSVGSSFIQNDSGALRFGGGGDAGSTSGVAEFMRIGTTGLVGIGTNSPDVKLDVARLGLAWTGQVPVAGTVAHFHNGNNGTSSAAYLGLGAGNNSFSGINFGDADDADVGFIRYYHGDNSLRINTNTSERLRITSDGRLGIGETSPDAYLHISDSGANDKAVLKLDTYRPKIRFQDRSTNSSDGEIKVDGNVMRFNLSEAVDDNTDLDEAFRLDSVGAMLFDSKKIRFGNGSDMQLWHNGTHSYIDNQEGNLYIRNNIGGDEGGDIHIEAKMGEKSISCLDDSNVLLYFNNVEKLRTTADGIAFNGDSAASNSLDDYEEGTWTPTPVFGGGSTGMTYTTPGCNYTKIGRTVTVKGAINFSNRGTSTGNLQVNGLPFAGTSDSYSHFTGACITFNGPNTDGTMNCFVSGTTLRFRMHNDANSNNKPQHTDFDNDTKFMFTVTYFV